MANDEEEEMVRAAGREDVVTAPTVAWEGKSLLEGRPGGVCGIRGID